MFKKYKQLFIGIIIGLLLATALPVGAAVEEYILYKSDIKLMLNDTEINITELPILNYQGYNYVSLQFMKKLCDEIGAQLNWVAEVKEVRITTPGVVVKTENEPSTPPESQFVQPGPPVPTPERIDQSKEPDEELTEEDDNVSESIVQTTDGLTVYEFDDSKYIDISDFYKKYSSRYYAIQEKWAQEGRTDIYTLIKKEENSWQSQSIILIDDIPHISKDFGAIYIPYDYYVNTILPLIE